MLRPEGYSSIHGLTAGSPKSMFMSMRFCSDYPERLFLGLLALAATLTASAGDVPAAAQQATPTKEMRAQMATVHEQMAACLRSDKPITECRTEMMKSCQKLMGTQGCSMMGMDQGAMGKHGGMMQSQPAGPEAKK